MAKDVVNHTTYLVLYYVLVRVKALRRMTIRIDPNNIATVITQLQNAQSYFGEIGKNSAFSFSNKQPLIGIEVISISARLANALNFVFSEEKVQPVRNWLLNIVSTTKTWILEGTKHHSSRLFTFQDVHKPQQLILEEGFEGTIFLFFVSADWMQENTPYTNLQMTKTLAVSPINQHAISQINTSQSTSLTDLRLLGNIFYNCIEEIKATEQPKSHEVDIERVTQYLLQHLHTSQPKSEELAKLAGMSVSSLKTKFKEINKLPIRDFFLREKMKTAKIMLSQGKYIKEVASALGYAHTSNFSHAFKKEFGINPSEIN